MDRDGFRKYLIERRVADEKIPGALDTVQRFESFLKGKDLSSATSDDARDYIDVMMLEDSNTYENFVTLLRYGYFIGNNDLYVSFLEPIDGSNVLEVLHEKLGERVGKGLRDKVFENIELPPMGTRPTDKPRITQHLMEKLEMIVDPKTCKKSLVDVAHGLSREYYDEGQREEFLAARNLDEYLEQRRNAFIAQLEKHRDEKTPFFNQEITDEVVQWIRDNPGIGTERREGEYLIHTKIPFLAKDYLAETDGRMRRYYACHCGWAREAIRTGKDEVSSTFCYCSAGFTVRPWEIAFDRPLEVEMLESALKGNTRCTFRIPIPREVLEKLEH
jgi:hypothetical protein